MSDATKPVTETPFNEQMHAVCGGSLHVVARHRKVSIICDRCRNVWDAKYEITAPDDWTDHSKLKLVGVTAGAK